ncbi:helix-turn-helix transcriptional regulator [Lewinella sp. 4G2]|uniref:ArsR/SmtB family transcription factor n=1 Tax=Lewinella sp. 4G2 TaxID=1803372 RepID=UPI0007B4ED16|nr:metalloregulator ArsR/SmtB family transcription factor [Lewinella sp. 4G2]
MTDPFNALADPTRRSMLMLLAERPRPVNELTEQFDISRPAVSKHLRVLEGANLVRYARGATDGRQRVVHAELQALMELDDYLSQLRQTWEDRLDKLGNLLDEMK